MPVIERNGTRLHYETFGDGSPVLLLAPGGLRASRIDAWDRAPWNPIEALSGSHRVVAMDQRNTGTSFAPIAADDGWPSYAGDQLAVMDHLGIERFSVVGMCIGGAFIMELIAEVPERIAAAVAMQPIGLDGNRQEFRQIFDEWRDAIAPDHPEANDVDWSGLWDNLYGADNLLWSVPDSFLPSIETPLLVLQGDDVYHPKVASRRLADAAPHATLIESWKDPADQPAARQAVDDFLAAHAPDRRRA
jgi:pimeloyl-ACP methyl ester carboxylesterase